MAWYLRLSFVAKTMLLVLFATLLVGIYWYTSRAVVERVGLLTAQGAKSQQARWLVSELEETAYAAHNALRGYALSSRDRFRTEYEQAVVRHGERTKQLAVLLQDDPPSLSTLKEADALWQNWLQSFALPTIQEIGAGQPVGIGRIDQSTDLMDQVHQRLHALQTKADASITAVDPKPIMREYYRNVVILNLLSLALVAIFFYAFANQLRQEVKRLIQGAEAVTAGQSGFQVPPVNTPELSKLVYHFNAMSRFLKGQAEELTAQREAIERDRDLLASLNRLVSRGQASRSLSDLCALILHWLLERAEAEVGAIIVRESGGREYIAARVGEIDADSWRTQGKARMAETIERAEVITAHYPGTPEGRPVFADLPVAHEAYFPIIYAGTPLAVVVLGSTCADCFPHDSDSMLRMTADSIGAVISNRISSDRQAEAYEQLRVRQQEISELSETVAHERDEAAQKRDLLQAILNSTGEGIFVSVRSLNRVIFNSHFFRMLNMETPDESTSFTEALRLSAPTLRQLGLAEIFQHLREHPEEVYSARIDHVGPEQRSLDWMSAPFRDAGGSLIGRVFVVRDVTQEVESERLKEEFISTVSHELRTPLTSIMGYLELLQDGDLGEVAPEQREVLAVMNQNAAHLLTLINDLLEIEKLSTGRLTLTLGLVNVAEILHRVVLMAEPAARSRGLFIHAVFDDGLPLVTGDEGRLVQVFTNLLSNAIKYTKEGGVTIRAGATDDWIRVAFTDTGIGIAPEAQRKLFTRFFRVDNAHTREVGGVGLGLAITKQLAERHGGRIEVESQPGVGSTFTVLLPVRSPEGGESDAEDRPGRG